VRLVVATELTRYFTAVLDGFLGFEIEFSVTVGEFVQCELIVLEAPKERLCVLVRHEIALKESRMDEFGPITVAHSKALCLGKAADVRVAFSPPRLTVTVDDVTKKFGEEKIEVQAGASLRDAARRVVLSTRCSFHR
jgi:hypothetical protein